MTATPHPDPTVPPITEEDIANYLLQTPGFFERHAEVLASVQLSSPHTGRAVSLQERQADLLRDKIRALELKVADLIRHAQDNTAIADKLHGWIFSLLRSRDAARLPMDMARNLELCFSVPQAALRVWGVDPQWANQPFAQGCSDDVKAFASSLLQPYCGGNPGLEAAGWLAESEAVQSMALIALRDEPGAPAFGLLVLGSPEATRFQADMGTDFLERIGELAGVALGRLRPPTA